MAQMVKNVPAVQDTWVQSLSREDPLQNTLQYSCLENFIDRGTWQAIVHGAAKTWLSDWFIFFIYLYPSTSLVWMYVLIVQQTYHTHSALYLSCSLTWSFTYLCSHYLWFHILLKMLWIQRWISHDLCYMLEVTDMQQC